MNNEINIKTPGQILDYVDTKEHLLDLFNYITNLQQENERLKKEENNDYVYLSRKYDFIADYNIKLVEKVEELEDYKSRCEKASEYIKEMLYPIGNCVNGSDLPYDSIECLLNILQNGSDKNE